MAGERDLSFQQRNLFQQGYQTYTPAELKQIDWGLRVTPTVCSSITLYALVTHNPALLFAVAFLGMWAFFFPAGHPMDLFYNGVVRRLFGVVKLPPNPLQRRLACFAAGIMNTMAAAFFLASMPLAARLTGGMLLVLQVIVIATHFCTLSWMYEALMRVLGRWSTPVDEGRARELVQGGALVVDVRGPDEYAREHLSRATNVPLEDLENELDSLRRQPVLVYCASGTRSQIARQRLEKLGLSHVYDMGSITRARPIVESTGH